ncbi:MAG: hypothetical protein AAGI01_10430 [Myxococcota bacterium]
MATWRMRPTFDLQVGLGVQEVERALGAALVPDGRIVGRVLTRQVEMTVDQERHHTWSPHLNLIVWEDEEGVRLEGKFGPSPKVWTLFMALYAVCVFTGGAALIMASSQVLLGQPPWALWVAAAMACALVVVYGIATVGKSLGHDQMLELCAFVTESVEQHLASEDEGAYIGRGCEGAL